MIAAETVGDLLRRPAEPQQGAGLLPLGGFLVMPKGLGRFRRRRRPHLGVDRPIALPAAVGRHLPGDSGGRSPQAAGELSARLLAFQTRPDLLPFADRKPEVGKTFPVAEGSKPGPLELRAETSL